MLSGPNDSNILSKFLNYFWLKIYALDLEFSSDWYSQRISIGSLCVISDHSSGVFILAFSNWVSLKVWTSYSQGENLWNQKVMTDMKFVTATRKNYLCHVKSTAVLCWYIAIKRFLRTT